MIDSAVDAAEFPFVEELPKREASKFVRVWENFQELSRLSKTEGMLIPQAFAAKVLGVHRSRVFQLVEEDRLKVVVVNGERFVTENSVVEYAKSERKAGRPVKVESDARSIGLNKACWKLAKEYAKEVVGGKK